jgi:uncharacterized protein (TIGR03382 family)
MKHTTLIMVTAIVIVLRTRANADRLAIDDLAAAHHAAPGSGTAAACGPGQMPCGNGCIPTGTVCCGTAPGGSVPVYCPANNVCTPDPSKPLGFSCCPSGTTPCGGGCTPTGTVCCGTSYCPAGQTCGPGNTCSTGGDGGGNVTCSSTQTLVDVTCDDGSETCGCSDPCSIGSDCQSGCCSNGHCMLLCVCQQQGEYRTGTCGSNNEGGEDPAGRRGCNTSDGAGAGPWMLLLGLVAISRALFGRRGC